MSGLSGRLGLAMALGLVGSMGQSLAGIAQAVVGPRLPYYAVRDGGKGRSRSRGGGMGLYTDNRGVNEAKRNRRAAWKEYRKTQVARLSKLGRRAPKLKGLQALRASYYGAPPA